MCGHTRGPVIYSKFRRNPFRGFGAPGGQNLAFPITLASRFYNSLYYRTSRDILVTSFTLTTFCFCSVSSVSAVSMHFACQKQYEDPPRHIADDIEEAKRRLAQRKQQENKWVNRWGLLHHSFYLFFLITCSLHFPAQRYPTAVYAMALSPCVNRLACVRSRWLIGSSWFLVLRLYCNFTVTFGHTCHIKWRIQRGQGAMPPKSWKLCNHHGIVAENSVKYVPSGGFFGIQILQNSISARAPPWTTLGTGGSSTQHILLLYSPSLHLLSLPLPLH